MTHSPRILALDLAARTGWALGCCDDAKPRSGSVRFARPGASMGAVFADCRQWLNALLDIESDIKLVVFEAPGDPRHFGPRRPETARILIGLAAVVEELTYTRGGLDVREASVNDVRRHFIGGGRHKAGEAKPLTIAACNRLGWAPGDDNAADALALWHLQASILRPALAVQTSPLFRRAIG
jgi:hypothetical protein